MSELDRRSKVGVRARTKRRGDVKEVDKAENTPRPEIIKRTVVECESRASLLRFRSSTS